ncbi:ThiF family adenylyltransferase [Rhodoferax sp. OV413]|uniref:ThiF family adenylyltransferase n=1 Tax=Rhodoferax sp. OV413 TaxID=1855285 RepID=UPI000B87E797|nr:ThiF family adenylyltransferase [Rhodoferax sp. OV413]
MHSALVKHLLGSTDEAAAIVLCARIEKPRVKLLAQKLIPVPHAACTQAPDFIQWPGALIEDALEQAEEGDLSLVLIHSHPGGYFDFSAMDDASDAEVMPAIFAARSREKVGRMLHGSAIMVPGGVIRARLYDRSMAPTPVELTAVYGEDISLFWNPHVEGLKTDTRPLAFTSDMSAELGLLSACFVGASGTGSIAVEQAARLGFGEVILIDFDLTEDKNLNRILNSTQSDAEKCVPKIDVLADAIARHHPKTVVKRIRASINCREAVELAAAADFLFCCVDSEEGRSICDKLASAMVMPLIDVGVTIPVARGLDQKMAIFDVLGRIDYVQPGGSSLADRKVFTPQSLAAEDLAKRAPQQHEDQVKAGYMPGLLEEAPSVISVNMRAASAAVQEFIARTYPYRLDGNNRYARTVFSLAAMDEDFTDEDAFPCHENGLLGMGLAEPLLGLINWANSPKELP